MNIYKVNFAAWVHINDDGEIDEEIENDDEGHNHSINADFSIAASNLPDAVVEAMDHLDENFAEWDLRDIILIAENVINWPENDEEPDWKGDCDCPYCTAENGKTPLDLIMNFEHSCGNKIKVSDNGWESIRCKKCDEWIDRIDVSRNEKGFLVFIKKEVKKEN